MRIHNSPYDSLDLSRQYSQLNTNEINYKPIGLWYAIGNEWVEYCEGEWPERVYPNNFEIEIDPSRLLIFENLKDIQAFEKKYSYSYKGFFDCIDRFSVAHEFSGIEIPNYYDIKADWWASREHASIVSSSYFYGWDVPSGCIWDLSIIRAVTTQSKILK